MDKEHNHTTDDSILNKHEKMFNIKYNVYHIFKK